MEGNYYQTAHSPIPPQRGMSENALNSFTYIVLAENKMDLGHFFEMLKTQLYTADTLQNFKCTLLTVLAGTNYTCTLKILFITEL